MPTTIIQEPKYNLHELMQQNFWDVRDHVADDASAMNVIQHAFREAAKEHGQRLTFLPNAAFTLGYTSAGVLLLTNAIYGLPHATLVEGLAVAAMSMWGGKLAQVVSNIDIHAAQFGKAEEGYPLLENAMGSKKVFNKAQGRIQHFLEAQRPPMQAPTGLSNAPQNA